jgi:uncharacterized protein YndB with AHSA1/START domain
MAGTDHGPDRLTLKRVLACRPENERPRRLAFTWHSPALGPLETLVTLTFEPRGAETELTLVHELLPDAEMRRRHEEGWGSIVDRLAAAL